MLKKEYNLERKEECFTTCKCLPSGGKVVEHYKVVEASPGVAIGFRNRMAKGFKIATDTGSAETSGGMFDAQLWVVSQCCFRTKVVIYDAAGNISDEKTLANPVPVTLSLVSDEWVTDVTNDLFNWISENSHLSSDSAEESIFASLCDTFDINPDTVDSKYILESKLLEFIEELKKTDEEKREDEAKN